MANINRVMSNNILTLHLKIIHLTSSVWSKITGSVVWGMSWLSTWEMGTFLRIYDLGTMLANYQKKNLIMHELRNNLNFYCSKSGNLYLRHYSNRSSEDFLLKIDIRNVRGHMKTCPCPSHTACNKYSFTPYRGHQVKTFWTRYMCKY